MNIIEKTCLNAKLRMQSRLQDFVANEEGDTNFVSMLIIIAVVVVLAGAFLKIVNKTWLETLKETVNEFIKNPT